MVVPAIILAATFEAWPTAGLAANVPQPRLLTAGNYTVIGGSTITNTGPTVITGNLALFPGTSVTGGPTVTGTSDVNDAAASQAQTDLGTTYNDAAGATCPATNNLSGTDLGGLTLTPGVYCFSTSAQLTGTLTLDGQGNTNPTFIFQIGSTLTTASASRVVLQNGAGACAVFWQVGSSATLGTTTSFQGNLITNASITMNTGATIGVGGGVNGGRALARTSGAVTLDTNTITPPPATCTFTAAATPTPSPGGGASPTPSSGGGAPGASPIPGNTGVPPQLIGPFPWLLLIGLGAAGAATALGVTRRRRRRSRV